MVWLFDMDATRESTLALEMVPAGRALTDVTAFQLALSRGLAKGSIATGPTRQPATALIAMHRAQAAKVLCDATYPDSQPDDYDRITWIAGMGVRLAATPANLTAELSNLAHTLEEGRYQLVALAARMSKSSSANRDRVRNATALMEETAPSKRQE